MPSSAKAVSSVKTQPTKAPVLVQQTAATSAPRQTPSAWQLLLLLRNSSHDDVRAHAANSLADHEKPTPAVVQALVSSAGADASSEVRLACLKTLLKLRVNDPTLPSTLMRLQTDQDARVRDAAKALHQQLQSRANAATPPRS
jgi:HEAT repeat protein